MESEEMPSIDMKDCDDVGHHSNKCCDDRREHNIAESLEAKFPLLCKGTFSIQQEKFYDMLINEIPEEYLYAVCVDRFQEQIEELSHEMAQDNMECRSDRD